jgi:hypothetical protein
MVEQNLREKIAEFKISQYFKPNHLEKPNFLFCPYLKNQLTKA